MQLSEDIIVTHLAPCLSAKDLVNLACSNWRLNSLVTESNTFQQQLYERTNDRDIVKPKAGKWMELNDARRKACVKSLQPLSHCSPSSADLKHMIPRQSEASIRDIVFLGKDLLLLTHNGDLYTQVYGQPNPQTTVKLNASGQKIMHVFAVSRDSAMTLDSDNMIHIVSTSALTMKPVYKWPLDKKVIYINVVDSITFLVVEDIGIVALSEDFFTRTLATGHWVAHSEAGITMAKSTRNGLVYINRFGLLSVMNVLDGEFDVSRSYTEMNSQLSENEKFTRICSDPKSCYVVGLTNKSALIVGHQQSDVTRSMRLEGLCPAKATWTDKTATVLTSHGTILQISGDASSDAWHKFEPSMFEQVDLAGGSMAVNASFNGSNTAVLTITI